MVVPVPEDALQVGKRFILEGEEFVINRVTKTAKNANETLRVQVDAMAVDEVRRRMTNLQSLLDGVAAGQSGTMVDVE